MFISFFLPTNVKHSQLEFVMFQQLGRFQSDEIHFIAPQFFFGDPSTATIERHFVSAEYQKVRKFVVPTFQKVQNANKSIIPDELFLELRAQQLTEDRTHGFLQEHNYPPFTSWLVRKFKKLLANGEKIEAIMTWRDCESLKLAAKELGIPVIHNEYAHFREPMFEDAIYFDLEGVKKSSAPHIAFKEFSLDDELKRLANQFAETFLNFSPAKSLGTKVGILLGVEPEKGFSENLTPTDLIVIAEKICAGSEVLIRRHPWAQKVTYSGYEYDETNSLEKIKKECHTVVTVYSNAGLELIPSGLRMIYLGPTPLTFLSDIASVDEMKLKLGFFVMTYLVPGDFLFSPVYYRWRLTKPSQREIAMKHLEYWEKKRETSTGNPRLFLREGSGLEMGPYRPQLT